MVRVLLLVCVSFLISGCTDGSADATNIPFRPKNPRASDRAHALVPAIRITGDRFIGSSEYLSVGEIEESGVAAFHVYDQPRKMEADFTGVLLRDFVGKWAPGSKRIVFASVSGEKVALTTEEWSEIDIVLATRNDSGYLTTILKGPVRIVIRFDDDTIEKRRTLHSKWIWQITGIHFE